MLDEPLGLTVYSLPRPQDALEGDGRRTRMGRLKMLVVLAVCAAPVLASYFALHGQWLLVSVAGGACDAGCENHLYLQRQLREGLGKDKDRLDWIWLVPDGTPPRSSLLPALAQATVLRVDGAQLGQWLAPAPGQQLADHLYLVDPMGNWMMRFPAMKAGAIDANAAKDIKHDLERLLRASASWDRPCRNPS